MAASTTSLVEQLRWVVRMRFAVGPVAVAHLLLGRSLTGIPFPIEPVVVLLGVVISYNAVFYYLLWHRPPADQEAYSIPIGTLGGALDLINLAVWVHFTGGVQSPWMYYPIVTPVASAAVLPWRSTAVLAVTAVATMTCVFGFESAGWFPVPFADAWAKPTRAWPGLVAIDIITLTFFMGVLAWAMGFLARQGRYTQEQLRHVADDQAALLELTRELSLSLAPPDVLQLLTRRGAQLVGCDMVGINLFDPVHHRTQVMALHGAPVAPEGAEPALRGIALDPEVLLAHPLLQLPSRDFPQLTPLLSQFGCTAALLVRMERGQVRGWVGFGKRTGERFDARQLALAQGIARYAAIAVENAQLYAAQRDSARVTEALVKLGGIIGTTLDQQELLERLTSATREVLETDWAVTYVWDEEERTFRVGALTSPVEDLVAEVTSVEFAPGSEPLIDRLLAGELVEVRDRNRQEVVSRALLARWRVASMLAVGVQCGDGPLGFIAAGFAQRRGAFSAHQHALLRGIAQQAAAALENVRLHDVAQTASRLKTDFLSTMSHELRSPLNVIIGYGDLLIEGTFGALNGEQLDVLKASRRKAGQLLDLINATLDLNRLEAGRDPVQRSVFPLVPLFSEVDLELEDIARSPAVQLRWETPSQIAALHTDRAKLKLVLKNVVSNALKFTPAGHVTVSAAVEPASGDAMLRVRDTGVGIAADDLPWIFEMFRQGPADRGSGPDGVGLGLYIAKRLVSELGGVIAVQSELGKGSTFEIRLTDSLPASRPEAG